jgi:hypothetical protein
MVCGRDAQSTMPAVEMSGTSNKMNLSLRCTKAGWPIWRRTAALVILDLVLFWLILSRSMAAYLAAVDPESALLLHPGDPLALIVLAEREINSQDDDESKKALLSGGVPERRSQLRRYIKTALLADPLNAQAYRLLGQLTETEEPGLKTKELTARLMQAAVRHSLNETIAAEWLMRKRFEEKNYRSSVFYGDIMLRARPQLMNFAIPILSRMAENKDAKDELVKVLASDPPWRLQFFNALSAAVSDANAPLEIFLDLKSTVAPPVMNELHNYLSFLFQHKLYDLAYYTWLQFLPWEQLESAGYLFNGSFEVPPSGLPFDWEMPQGANISVEIAQRPDGSNNQALFLMVGPGRVNFPGVFQWIMLPPGAYKFEGSLKGEVAGQRGIVWRVSCLEGAPIGASRMILGSFPVWHSFEFAFTVPDSGCRPQVVSLELAARSDAERLVSGSIWFEELSISQHPDPAN